MTNRLKTTSFAGLLVVVAGLGCTSIQRESLENKKDWRQNFIPHETLDQLTAHGQVAVLSPDSFTKILKVIPVHDGLRTSDVAANFPSSNFFTNNEFLVIKEKAMLRRALPFSTQSRDVEWNKFISDVILYPGDLIILQGIE